MFVQIISLGPKKASPWGHMFTQAYIGKTREQSFLKPQGLEH